MPNSETFSLVRRISQAGTLLRTFLCGKQVGRDQFGNRYYCERGKPLASNGCRVRQKRWVIYEVEPEPTKIPPEWHIWLHYAAEAPIPISVRKTWQKPYSANNTGTSEAWMPPSLKGDSSFPMAELYEAWKP